MKRMFFLILLCCLMVNNSLFGNPSIDFIKTVHDFGTIKQNTIVKESITFKNNGDSDLIIKKIRTSCGCTETKTNKDKISPGEDGILEISFNSGNDEGQVTKSIYIYTNIPDKEKVVFKIKANVIK
ncbi:MAG: DUF1573 domain-containing protein [Spirochaetota bacterium]